MFIHIIVDNEADGVYMANAIEDGESFYPDMLYHHDFKEMKITGSGLADIYKNAVKDCELHRIAIFLAPESGIEEILIWADSVRSIGHEDRCKALNTEDINHIRDVAARLRFTRTMTDGFESLARKYKIIHSNLDFIKQFEDVQINTKGEARSVYGYIRVIVEKSLFSHIH